FAARRRLSESTLICRNRPPAFACGARFALTTARRLEYRHGHLDRLLLDGARPFPWNMRPARAAGLLSGVHSSPLIGGGEPDRIDAIDNGAHTTSSGEVARPTVLVVDDDEEARVALARILATDGFEAITAVDGEAAIGQIGRASCRERVGSQEGG